MTTTGSIPLLLSLPRPQTESAIPEPIVFEDTGEISAAVSDVLEATDMPEELIEALAKKLAEHSPTSALSKQGEDKLLKDFKRHKWIAAFAALILGPGGMIGAYYAIRDRSIANSAQVESLKKDTAAVKPNTEAIRLIEIDVQGIDTSMRAVRSQSASIVKGIEELKEVNVHRLEDELAETKRALQRERNRR